MGSSSKPLSTSLFNPVLDLDDLDSTTSKLIAELLIQDIADIDSRRKGKAKADAPRSDEELAFSLQRELWESTLRTVEDYIMAKSLDDAIASDHRLLRTTLIQEQAAQDDRRAALALNGGNPLPPLSDAQRLVEDANFSELAAPLPGENRSAPGSETKQPEGKERRYVPTQTFGMASLKV
ncbi:hypothetical protein H0H92_013850 [Tricholoma furcatifolium]|nr:hypothetical protein H0H92_013850 [Tricholoma furcatifolium]